MADYEISMSNIALYLVEKKKQNKKIKRTMRYLNSSNRLIAYIWFHDNPEVRRVVTHACEDTAAIG